LQYLRKIPLSAQAFLNCTGSSRVGLLDPHREEGAGVVMVVEGVVVDVTVLTKKIIRQVVLGLIVCASNNMELLAYSMQMVAGSYWLKNNASDLVLAYWQFKCCVQGSLEFLSGSVQRSWICC
jgi:hypothetical protein